MKNSIINRRVVKVIATALGTLNERAAYVGGAIVSLYANDPAADDVRPTKDLDLTLEIASFTELNKLETELAAKGFKPDSESGIICRFKYKDVLVDIMATKEIGWAPSNKWFAPGFAQLQKVVLDDISINILPLSYFLASKFSAFHNRASDARTSHDFEDIVYILDNNTSLVQEIVNAPEQVKTYLKEELNQILHNAQLQEAVLAQLEYTTQAERFQLIMDKLKQITTEEIA